VKTKSLSKEGIQELSYRPKEVRTEEEVGAKEEGYAKEEGNAQEGG
jgi:hypothetical protein